MLQVIMVRSWQRSFGITLQVYLKPTSY